MSTYPLPHSPLFVLAISFVSCLNANDFLTLETLLDDDSFRHKLWPSTIRPDGYGEAGSTKREFIQQGRQMAEEIVETLAIDINHPINVVEEKDTVVLHLTSNGKLRSGQPLAMEYCFIIRFNGEGRRIIAVDEFIDSALAERAFQIKPSLSAEGSLNF